MFRFPFATGQQVLSCRGKSYITLFSGHQRSRYKLTGCGSQNGPAKGSGVQFDLHCQCIDFIMQIYFMVWMRASITPPWLLHYYAAGACGVPL
jgi:hypothetical protein